MTTTCEHGRERDTCPECGALARTGSTARAVKAAVESEASMAKTELLVAHGEQEAQSLSNFLGGMGQPMPPLKDGMRPLTDVEEEWVRRKHLDMNGDELNVLIAEGLPDDVEPITRADLPSAPPTAVAEPHAFTRTEWAHRKRGRKISAANRARNRRIKKSRKR